VGRWTPRSHETRADAVTRVYGQAVIYSRSSVYAYACWGRRPKGRTGEVDSARTW